MKALLKVSALLGLLIIALSSCTSNSFVFELSPQQSMIIIGKGPGQDAAFNPYEGSRSIAKVKNLNSKSIEVRIQNKKKDILTLEPLKEGEVKSFVLEKDDELYLDTETVGKAKVTFQKARE